MPYFNTHGYLLYNKNSFETEFPVLFLWLEEIKGENYTRWRIKDNFFMLGIKEKSNSQHFTIRH